MLYLSWFQPRYDIIKARRREKEESWQVETLAATPREISSRKGGSAFLHALNISMTKHSNKLFLGLTSLCLRTELPSSVSSMPTVLLLKTLCHTSSCLWVTFPMPCSRERCNLRLSGLQWVHFPMFILCCPKVGLADDIMPRLYRILFPVPSLIWHDQPHLSPFQNADHLVDTSSDANSLNDNYLAIQCMHTIHLFCLLPPPDSLLYFLHYQLSPPPLYLPLTQIMTLGFVLWCILTGPFVWSVDWNHPITFRKS